MGVFGGKAPPPGLFGEPAAPGLFCREVSLPFLRLLKILNFPLTRSGAVLGAAAPGLFCREVSLPFLRLLKILIFPSTRSGRAGPLLSGQQKVGKDWPKRAAPPLGFPLAVALARPSAAIRAPKEAIKSGFDGTPSRCAAEASGRFAKALPAKPKRTRYHARARMTSKRPRLGTLGGKGAPAPTPKRWRCGGRSERACARAFPQRHRSSSREAARSSANPDSAARLGGFQRGGVQHPTLVRGFARG